MIHLDAVAEMVKDYKFNLAIPTEDEEPTSKIRLEKKSFAIACRTDMTCNIYLTNEF